VSAIRVPVAALPPTAEIEVWGDNTVWIVDNGLRVQLREWVYRSIIQPAPTQSA
jgi:hypothetical protein